MISITVAQLDPLAVLHKPYLENYSLIGLQLDLPILKSYTFPGLY